MILVLLNEKRNALPPRVPHHPPPNQTHPDLPPPRDHTLRGGGDERVLALLELVGRRWALRVLWELQDGPLGFRALQARGDGISASVLARRLSELVAAGILAQDAERRYALTADGQSLTRVLTEFERWVATRDSRGSA